MKGREEEEKKEMRQMRRGGKRSDWKVTGQPLYERPSAMCSDQWGLRRFSFTSGSEILSWKLQTSFSLVHWFTLQTRKKNMTSELCVCHFSLSSWQHVISWLLINILRGRESKWWLPHRIPYYTIYYSLSFDIQQYVVNKLLIWKKKNHIISIQGAKTPQSEQNQADPMTYLFYTIRRSESRASR